MRNTAKARHSGFGMARFDSGSVSSKRRLIHTKLIKVRIRLTSAGTENGFTPKASKPGAITVKSILAKSPPMAGPTIKPKPKAIPTIASPLDRFSRVVESATAAVATDRLPPIAPPKTRASNSTQKEEAKNQAM